MKTLMSASSSKSLLVTMVCSGLLLSPLAYAQNSHHSQSTSEVDKMGVSVGVNVIAEKSAYDTDNKLNVLPSMFYDNDKIYARGSQFGGYLVKNTTHEVAGFIQPEGRSFDPDDAEGKLKNLDERKWSGLAGASYLYRSPIGGFRAQVATDITGRSDGTVAKLTYIARFNPGKWTIYPTAGVQWVDKNYNEYYYGVSDQESASSGVTAYTPDSSINPFININGTYTINKDWDLFLGQSINFLSDEQRDSPMVNDKVDYRTTVGVLYKF